MQIILAWNAHVTNKAEQYFNIICGSLLHTIETLMYYINLGCVVPLRRKIYPHRSFGRNQAYISIPMIIEACIHSPLAGSGILCRERVNIAHADAMFPRIVRL